MCTLAPKLLGQTMADDICIRHVNIKRLTQGFQILVLEFSDRSDSASLLPAAYEVFIFPLVNQLSGHGRQAEEILEQKSFPCLKIVWRVGSESVQRVPALQPAQ